ncbi:mannosyl-oligosaccharide glucosidase [Pipra filicauda]|uniref:Mannosyl-oligosaccharide glucosidase n=1 Tax=Pipra filicauda TaxID=649802 RepID=A0A6J2HFK2_9PASS|nr:mannosyl-oligosaccharide glucosidase [Pipra filicauda]
MAGERRRRGGDGPRERPRERDPKHRQQQKQQQQPRGPGRGRTVLVASAAAAALALGLVAAATEWSRWSEASRLVTPHPAPPAVPPGSTGPLASPTYFWGTYRPHVYFGMKTRSPRSVVTGLMWLQHGGGLRHTCDSGDGPARYGWVMHDGENFGVQEIRDGRLLLRTEFVKQPGGDHGGDWSWRVTARTEGKGPAPLLSLFFYVATDGQGELRPVLHNGTRLAAVEGTSEELGNFTLTFLPPTGEGEEEPKYASYNFLAAGVPGLHRLTELVQRSLREASLFSPPGRPRRHYLGVSRTGGLPGEPPQGQLLLHQVTLEAPAVLEAVLESGSAAGARRGRLAGRALGTALARHAAAFERRFEDTFGLGARGATPPQRRFAQAALSELLGGLGFFHGRSLLRSERRSEPLPGPEAVLFTAAPSRSCFPRGFLWDEGFHLLLLGRWAPALARDVLAHWLDLMNADGWIPREQILGDEARARVPPEFVLQHSETANPPTLLLALERLLPDAPLPYLRRLSPRLRAWFSWLNRTQAGPEPLTFRWRGRDTDAERFLNPKTLASGLDDYPRASHPSEQERHLDLRCWMALGARVLAALAERLGEPPEPYGDMALALSDNALLERHHWAPELGAFADFGNHSTAVALRWHRPAPVPGQAPPAPRLHREVREAPRPRFVGALGYVSLFPLLLQLLRADSPRLPALLGAMRSEAKLWTPFGLRSLARDSPWYLQRNTEHDPPYWRGSVWVNMNFLALRALHGYAHAAGPHREQAARLYRELRHNLVTNMFRQHEATGFLWEQYRDSDGAGQGCHPFAGWSALVVLAMAEDY